MRIPTVRGIIDRRLLVNYRVDPFRLAKILPEPFEPQLVDGHGIAGICLIRLKRIRPRLFPSIVGIGSENAAHRIAVTWKADGESQSGVYVPRRDTNSVLNSWAGGRVFPGVHHRANFEVEETDSTFRVCMNSVDGTAHLTVNAEAADQLPASSVFDSVEHVSDFFEQGSLGYSPSHAQGEYDGIELQSFNWQVEPLSVRDVESSFFDDRKTFPEGSVEFDNALLMRGIDHQWRGRESLCCQAQPS